MKKCSSCGFKTEDDNMGFCPECGHPLNDHEKAAEESVQSAEISEDKVPTMKKPRHKALIAAICSVSGIVLIAGAAVGIIALEKGRSNDDIAVSVPISETEPETETVVFTTTDIPEFQTTTETTTTTKVTTTKATTTTAAQESGSLGFLTDVSDYSGYSFYDVFTDVKAVFDIINANRYYADPISYQDCYNYSFSFSTDGYMYFYGKGWGEADWIPISKVEPYLKYVISPSLRLDIYYDDWNGYRLHGNTAGNYSNFSGLTEGYTRGLRDEEYYGSEIIYCGGNDYSSWNVRAAWADGSFPCVIVNDLSDMVMSYDSYIFYRKTDEDCRLYRVNSDGTNKIRLTESRCSNARIYDDKIYYCENKKFYSMDLDGRNKTLLIGSNCYLPNFYNNCMYCISSDSECIMVYDLYSGRMVDQIFLANGSIYIDNFFIQENILVAKGHYTSDDRTVVAILDLNNEYDCHYYDLDAGGINAYDNYIYVSYEENGKVYIGKIPLHDYSNSSAAWSYEIPGMINSYFYIVEHTEESSHLGKYIYQNDYEGVLHRYDLP
ncbi:MAG: DUF5050 domain-containing protein [Oscillospiraceae bacterium]